jgi:hypothetical protein
MDFRILAKRDGSGASIFAAGFDSSRNIFLGEKATKWESPEHEVRGMNGLGSFSKTKRDFCRKFL